MVVEGAEVVELFLVVDFSTICGVVETVDLAVLKLVAELGAAVVEDGAAVVEVGAAVVEVGAAVVELGVVDVRSAGVVVDGNKLGVLNKVSSWSKRVFGSVNG